MFKTVDILHNHNKIDRFLGFVFSQETMEYSSIIRNTFYGIIHSTCSTRTCTACKLVTRTSSNICERELDDITMADYNCTSFCYAPKPGPQSRSLCGAVCALSIAIILY